MPRKNIWALTSSSDTHAQECTFDMTGAEPRKKIAKELHREENHSAVHAEMPSPEA